MEVLLVITLALLNCLVNGQYTDINSCEDGSLLPDVKLYAGVNATLCLSQPCVVVPTKDILIHIFFHAPRYLEHIKLDVVASTVGVSLNYPLFQDSACDGIVNTYCPLVKSETVEYVHTMHLLDIFPEITVNLKFSLIDQDTSSNVLCFKFDIKVVKIKS